MRPVHKSPIDFEFCKGKPSELLHRRETGAEIVNRDTTAF